MTSFRLKCEHATFFSSQMIESKDSRLKKIRKIKRIIHSKEKFNKEMFFRFNEFIV
jgi:hypothetical protein